MSDPAADFFEGICGQCQSWQPMTGYVLPGKHCLNDESAHYGQARKGWDKACVEFLYKG